MNERTNTDCPDCGLPIVECNAVALAQRAVEAHLRHSAAYSWIDARAAASRLVPTAKRPEGMLDAMCEAFVDADVEFFFGSMVWRLDPRAAPIMREMEASEKDAIRQMMRAALDAQAAHTKGAANVG